MNIEYLTTVKFIVSTVCSKYVFFATQDKIKFTHIYKSFLPQLEPLWEP